MLLLLLVSTWIGVGVARQTWGDGLGGWRAIPANACALIANKDAARRHRVPLVLGSWAWVGVRTGWRGARRGHRSVVAGARWGYREGHERCREWEERALLRQEIVLAAQQVDVGSGSVTEVRRLEQRLQELEARQLAHRTARGSAWIRRWDGPVPVVVDGKLQFGSDPDDRAGRADCLDCAGSGSCMSCERRQTLLAEWDKRGEQSAVEWYSARRQARHKAAADMENARDRVAWDEAHVRYAATRNADWGRSSQTSGNGNVTVPAVVPIVSEDRREQVMSTPNGNAPVDAETMTYPAVLRFLGSLSTELSNWGAWMEIASASLAQRRLGALTMAEMSAVDEALQGAFTAVNAALAGIQSRHGGINDAVSGATELADLDFYNGN